MNGVPDLEDVARQCSAAARPPCLLPVQIILTGGLGQAFPGHQVHHRRLARGQAQGGQGDVAVKEAALVDQSEDFCFGHLPQTEL